MKCIAVNYMGAHPTYLTPRRSTGRVYESRSGWSADINDAKVFQSANAAANSAQYSHPAPSGFKVVPVRIVIDEDART